MAEYGWLIHCMTFVNRLKYQICNLCSRSTMVFRNISKTRSIYCKKFLIPNRQLSVLPKLFVSVLTMPISYSYINAFFKTIYNINRMQHENAEMHMWVVLSTRFKPKNTSILYMCCRCLEVWGVNMAPKYNLTLSDYCALYIWLAVDIIQILIFTKHFSSQMSFCGSVKWRCSPVILVLLQRYLWKLYIVVDTSTVFLKNFCFQWPLLLTWNNFNPSMDKLSHYHV